MWFGKSGKGKAGEYEVRDIHPSTTLIRQPRHLWAHSSLILPVVSRRRHHPQIASGLCLHGRRGRRVTFQPRPGGGHLAREGRTPMIADCRRSRSGCVYFRIDLRCTTSTIMYGLIGCIRTLCSGCVFM